MKYKFRGIDCDGEFVRGNLTILERTYETAAAGMYISNLAGAPFAYEVIPHTVGMCIDREDVNGTDIYEGDIVECDRYGPGVKYVVIVEDIRNIPLLMYGSELNFIKVVGNIHMNPELVKMYGSSVDNGGRK